MTLKEKRLEEFKRKMNEYEPEGFVLFPTEGGEVLDNDSLIKYFSDSIDMAYEEGRKDHECIRHECALYIKHCKENHTPNYMNWKDKDSWCVSFVADCLLSGRENDGYKDMSHLTKELRERIQAEIKHSQQQLLESLEGDFQKLEDDGKLYGISIDQVKALIQSKKELL